MGGEAAGAEPPLPRPAPGIQASTCRRRRRRGTLGSGTRNQAPRTPPQPTQPILLRGVSPSALPPEVLTCRRRVRLLHYPTPKSPRNHTSGTEAEAVFYPERSEIREQKSNSPATARLSEPLGYKPELGGSEKPVRSLSLAILHDDVSASSLLRLSLAVELREGAGKLAARPRPRTGANPEQPRGRTPEAKLAAASSPL